MTLPAEDVLRSRPVQKISPDLILPRHRELAKEFNDPLWQEFVAEMLPDFHSGFLKKSIHFISGLFKGVASHTWVVGGGCLEQLKKSDSEYSLVFICNHRSNLDYVFLPLMLNRFGINPVHILANSKLNLFPFGWLFKKWGTFFVRQREHHRHYYALLKAWGNYLLDHKHNLVFFPEGGLSRDGKLRKPQTGFLKTLLESPHAHKIIVVPVMFAYDWIPEDENLNSRHGHKPEHWRYWNKVKMLKFFRNYGDMYCRLYEPIPLENWLKESDKDLPEKLLSQVFDLFNSDSLISPSTLLATAVLEVGQSQKDQIRTRFEALSQKFQNQIAFDAPKDFERIWTIFEKRKILKESNLLQFYANQAGT